jgi:hypothetical protein
MTEESEAVTAFVVACSGTDPDPEPGPVAVAGAQLDPIQHTHPCSVCFKDEPCSDFCATDMTNDERLVGAAVVCDACRNAVPDSIDIVSGKVFIGDRLRCAQDGLVYEVEEIDERSNRAELHTIIGYPNCHRTMRLAIDGSPARTNGFSGYDEPLWFRVKP